MILNKKTKISINSSNIIHYSKWYKDIEVFDIIEVEIDKLTKGSNAKIKVKCDNCGLEKELQYKNYNKYGYKNSEWLCRECKKKKNIKEKYGVENIFQLKEIKEKTKKTVRKKWGVDYISQSKKIQEKIKKNKTKKNK